ncbi:MAG: glycoside hydrolase family 78 protein [Butyrivibrio sp.]|nr:glycoside hydrolase family 78 protein [Butyrivibrio sp.]
MKINHLRTSHMENPVGIADKPYFSWVIESEKNNVLQEAYAIRVMNLAGECLWNTGWIKSSNNSFILYEGKKLEQCTLYIWSVEVKDNYGEIATATTSFETAINDAGGWKARWVEDSLQLKKREHGFGNQPPATMFRKTFTVDDKKSIEKVRVYASAHGVYNLYINGCKVGDRELAPGYASYDKIQPFQTYELTDLVSPGKNVIGMYVGDGWYFSPETSMDNTITSEGHHGVIFEIHVEYTDGCKEIICSDENVKVSYGPVISSDMFAGESYDATKECYGWNTYAYDDRNWSSAVVTDCPTDNLMAEADDIITAVKEFEALDLLVTPNGEKVIDFGQNMAGRIRFKCSLPKNYKISLVHFETLDENGNFFNTIVSTNGVGAGADQRVEYISSGEERVYEPLFTYFGFRYVCVKICDEKGKEVPVEMINKDDFTAVALSTKKENLGSFECSDERLNRLYTNIRWSQYSNMISIPTDCPQREKAGWTGDAAIYIETALLNEDVTPLFSRWMKSVAADQQDDGMVPMVVPFNDTYRKMAAMMGQMTQMNALATSAGWGDVVTKVPWTMYKVTGNRHILQEHYQTMKKWCDYVVNQAKKRVREDLPKEKEMYLWNSGFHYGEWLIPSTSEAGFTDENAVGMAMAMTAQYTAPIYGYYSVSTFAKIARELGKSEDYEHYSSLAEKMKEAIQSCLIGPNGEVPAEYMGAYVLFLYFDLVPEKFRKKYEDRLAEMIEQNNNCLDTGFLATPYLLETLEKIGRDDLAFSLVFQTKSPSWLYEVEHGATTIWETWNAISDENIPQHVSMNHYSFGCVASWIFKTLGGIRSVDSKSRHWVIEPKPDGRIDWSHREYMTEQGLISCKWRRNGEKVDIKVSIPCNATATVILPNGNRCEIGSGNYEYAY